MLIEEAIEESRTFAILASQAKEKTEVAHRAWQEAPSAVTRAQARAAYEAARASWELARAESMVAGRRLLELLAADLAAE